MGRWTEYKRFILTCFCGCVRKGCARRNEDKDVNRPCTVDEAAVAELDMEFAIEGEEIAVPIFVPEEPVGAEPNSENHASAQHTGGVQETSSNRSGSNVGDESRSDDGSKDASVSNDSLPYRGEDSYAIGEGSRLDESTTGAHKSPHNVLDVSEVLITAPEVPVNEPQKYPVGEPEVPVNEPQKYPVGEPTVPIINEPQEYSVGEPEVLATEPEVSESEPEVPVRETEVPVSEPEVPASEPEVPTSEPEVPTSESEVPASEHDAPVTEPESEPDVQ